MLLRPEIIHSKAARLVKRYRTKDTLRIAEGLGIYLRFVDGLEKLLGMYIYQHKERHILLNNGMEDLVTQMVCGHEIGHDVLHREQAKVGMGLQEFTLFDIRNEKEYDANDIAAQIRNGDEELIELLRGGYDVVQISSTLGTNVNLTLIKLNELNRMGWKLDLPYLPKADFLKNLSLDNLA